MWGEFMKKYRFFDTDISGREEFDITGIQYINLLETCFLYCDTVAMCLSPQFEKDLSFLQKYRVAITPTIKQQFCHYGKFLSGDTDPCTNYTIVQYSLTAKVKEYILECTNAMFKWTYAWGYKNPDDVTFFRSDGTVFFSSIIHEGECTLYVKEYEDVSKITNDNRWIVID